MARSARALFVPAVATALLMACTPPPLAPREPPPAEPAPRVVEPPLARGWRYHPPAWDIHDRVLLDDGSWLFVGELGERWLALPADATGRDRHADAAHSCAPEALRHAVRWSEDRWLFAAESGAVYEATAPMGPLAFVSQGPGPIYDFAGRRGVLAALDPLGKVYRFDGAMWHAVEHGGAIHELAATAKGTLLGLTFPEQLATSSDGGATFVPLAVARFGAHALVETDDGGIDVSGMVSDLRLAADGRALGPGSGGPTSSVPAGEATAITPRAGPSAEALVEGRAAIDGARYFEVRAKSVACHGCEGAEARRAWSLAEGRLDGVLDERLIALDPACADARVAVHGEVHAVACLTEGEPRDVLVFRSVEGALLEKYGPPLVASRADGIELGVAGDGAIVLFGVAPRDAPGTRVAIARLGDGGSLTLARAPELVGAPSGVAWSSDGRRAYFVGERDKGGALAPFVSVDGGRSFSAIALRPESDRDAVFVRAFGERAASGERRILPGNDGELGLVVASSSPRYAFAKRDGTIASVAEWPRRTPLIGLGGAGDRLFVIHGELSARGASMWQSIDGGRSFQPIVAPFPIGAGRPESLEVACVSGACVVSNLATRIGWDVPAAGQPRTNESVPRVAPVANIAVRVPIRCKLDAPGWRSLGDLNDGRIPAADEAFRGASVWAASIEDPSTGEVVVIDAARDTGGPDQLRRHTLLPRSRSRGDVAIRTEAQAEGFVALSAVLAGAHRGELEVAAIDLFTGRSVAEKLRGQASLEDGDVTVGERSHLLSGSAAVVPDGIVVRPSTRRAEIFFVPSAPGAERAHSPLAAPSWPPSTRVTLDTFARTTAVLGVGLFLDEHVSRAASVARLDGDERIDVGLAPASGPRRVTVTHWSYRGAEAGVTVSLVQRDLQRAASYFVPWSAASGVGAAIAVPTQRALETPRPCSDDEVRTTPRVVAPFLVGTRHPVIIDDFVEGLMTSEAILHGSPDRPCLLGYVADVERRGGARAFLPASLGRSWLLRVSPRASRAIDVAAMECAFAPEVAAPPWIARFAATERLP